MMPLSAHIFKVRSPLRQSGFTMLEILASIAIMAIAVLPLLGLIASTPAIHVRREREVRATFLAELRLEEVKGAAIYNYDFNLDGGGYSTSSPEDFPVDEGFKTSDSIFRYTVSDVILEIIGKDDIPILRDITVTVWHDQDGSNTINGTETSVVLRTKVARRL